MKQPEQTDIYFPQDKQNSQNSQLLMFFWLWSTTTVAQMRKPRLSTVTSPQEKSNSPDPKFHILLAKPYPLCEKTFKTEFTQDHCGEGGLVLALVHSCKPDASLHMYLSVGRPLQWNRARRMQGIYNRIPKGREEKTALNNEKWKKWKILCTNKARTNPVTFHLTWVKKYTK